MIIGITGADGFLGFHTLALLHAKCPNWHVKTAGRETFAQPTLLDTFLSDLDVVIHFAGMNRGTNTEIETTNINIANVLVNALQRNKLTPVLIYSNSTHHFLDTPYGRGKNISGLIFEEWGKNTSNTVYNMIIPNVFGEFGKPFYNSVVATFCHQLSMAQQPTIQVDANLELMHAQDVASSIVDIINNHDFSSNLTSKVFLHGAKLSVSDLLRCLTSQLSCYRQNVLPNLNQAIDLNLFNTLRCCLFDHEPIHKIQQHNDNRGVLFEAVKTDQGGQAFISRTHPGITRGNHYHMRKIERFLVIDGQAEIRLRRLFTDSVISIKVSGHDPIYIDIPTFYTHNITNTGSNELITLFWSNEFYDINNSDTYHEVV